MSEVPLEGLARVLFCRKDQLLWSRWYISSVPGVDRQGLLSALEKQFPKFTTVTSFEAECVVQEALK